MKKVVVISSSPRKGGNSDVLCDKFIEGAISAGNQAEKISLRDKSINYCTGCGFCNTNNYTACSQKDDMEEILNKMLDADVIVFGTPIYFYAMSGQMKTFIDRLCAKYTHLSNKEFYYIMTAADTSEHAVQFALGEFKGLMACLDSAKEKGYLFTGGVWQKGEVLDTNYIDQAFEMGKNI